MTLYGSQVKVPAGEGERAAQLAVLLRDCRRAANAADKAGRPEQATPIRARAAELAQEVRAMTSAHSARKEAEAHAYWLQLQDRMVADLLTLARELGR